MRNTMKTAISAPMNYSSCTLCKKKNKNEKLLICQTENACSRYLAINRQACRAIMVFIACICLFFTPGALDAVENINSQVQSKNSGADAAETSDTAGPDSTAASDPDSAARDDADDAVTTGPVSDKSADKKDQNEKSKKSSGEAPDGESGKEKKNEYRSLLWKVTDKENRHLWLLGSIHVADESLYPLPERVEKAWAESEVLVVEADVVNVDISEVQVQMAKAAIDLKGRKLSDRLSPELYKETNKHLMEFGMHISLFETMRPWFVAMMLANLAMEKAGFTGELGIENHLLNRAGERPIVELEGMEKQLNFFASFSDEVDVLFLEQSLVDVKDTEKEIRLMLEAWRSGNDDLINDYRKQMREAHPKFHEIDNLLFTVRNRDMTEKIIEYFKAGKIYFVVIGAAHMPGEDGILNLLKKQGYKVERK